MTLFCKRESILHDVPSNDRHDRNLLEPSGPLNFACDCDESALAFSLAFSQNLPRVCKKISCPTDKPLIKRRAKPNSPTLVTEHHPFHQKQLHQFSHDIVAQHVDGFG
jgi:hypothetical protein